MRLLWLVALAGCRWHFDEGNEVVPRCIADDFDDGTLDPRWTVLVPNGEGTDVIERGGEIAMVLRPNTAGYNGVTTPVDLTDDSTVEVAFTPTSNAGFVETLFVIELDADNHYLLSTGAGSFVVRAVLDGVLDQDILTWDETVFRQLRFQHLANQMVLATSDGATWTERRRFPIVAPLDRVVVSLEAGAFGTGNAAPGEGRFDNLRVSGPSCP